MMEAAGALRRSGPSVYLEALGAALRARSRTFWIVLGLAGLGAALRFATLGLQSYHHDEIVTASRILRGDFWHAMDAVGFSESAPPLYYALAWLWAQLTGTGEFGLRSFSAFAGAATVPVAYLLGAELRGRRTGIAAAALVAVNPMLLWYSQEARAYALFALLAALSLLYFLRALHAAKDVPVVRGQYGYSTTGTSRDVVLWGVFSALALATHYFAVFPIAAEAVWLLWRGRRAALPGLAIVAVVGLLLAPLAIHQMSIGHAEWIGGYGLGHRLWGSGITFLLGETGDVIARPVHPLLALPPALFAAAAMVAIVLRGEGGERRAAGTAFAIAAATVAAPAALGLLDPAKDYVLARNLMPAVVPALLVLAIGFTLRRARRLGMALGSLFALYSLAFCIWASASPSLQRPSWDSVAASLGEPARPRAIVTWTLGEASLRYYLLTGAFQVLPSDGYRWQVGELDFVSDGPAPVPPAHMLGPRFHQVGYERVGGRLYVRRYAVPGPGLAPLRLAAVRDARLGFRSNGILLDGIGVR
jgi:4-amino-4-deoxy-L-arabinose transferase-like glycosyltransferase